MRVILTGGGTGGHIYPALSVAEALSNCEILYVGSADGPEARIVPASGVEFRSVPTRKLSRRPTLGSAVALAICAGGVIRGMEILRSWKPDVVLGTGGFASAGMMFAAGMLRVPSVIHEANAVPGRANQLLSRFCTRVAVTYPQTERYFPGRNVTLTGIPVRTAVRTADAGRAVGQFGIDPARPLLFVTGGSGGAKALNRAVVGSVERLMEHGIQVFLQTGRTQYDEVAAQIGSTSRRGLWIAPYVDDVPSLLAASSVVLCRGGSSTLAEVTALGRPAIVAPYPYAVADHQTGNARVLADAGAALLVTDAELTSDRLTEEVIRLTDDRELAGRMASASRSLGRPDAADRVARLLRETAESGRRQG